MSKPFQNALLLCVRKYSLFNTFMEILKELSSDVTGFDIRERIQPLYLRMHPHMSRLPYKARKRWEKFLFNRVNTWLLEEINGRKPDLVFVYNSEFLLPKTCAEIKKKARLVFFMGDSPFYTPVNPFYLTCLSYADLILSPDTFWIQQLNTTGLHKTSFFVPGIDLSSYNLLPGNGMPDEPGDPDILYTGACYVNSWGYKKALLMSKFANFRFKIYGNSAWERWFDFFPELKPVFIRTDFIPTPQLNRMYNKSKMIPVDGNPAILNGFHIRLFEALGSGSLPLVEYRKDVEELVFSGCDAMVPLIRDYSTAADVAGYYLKNEEERKELVATLRTFAMNRYSAPGNADIIRRELKKHQ